MVAHLVAVALDKAPGIHRDRSAWTRSRRAGVWAGVIIDLIAVIAVLVGTDDPVTADGVLAGVGAGVGVDPVGVVAGFDARLDKAITALRDDAAVQARIGLVGVAVVASLDAFLSLSVTAARRHAGV